MLQSQQANRRSGKDRRKDHRGPDRRRNGGIFTCAYGTIHNIMQWTEWPATSGEKNLFKRNWRSWFGHFTVAFIVTAFGRWAGLHTSFFWHEVGHFIPYVFAFGVGLFYFWREFGIGGNYWSYLKAKRVGHDGESDSVIDFWITLPAIYTVFALPLPYSVLIGFLLMAGIYTLAHTTD